MARRVRLACYLAAGLLLLAHALTRPARGDAAGTPGQSAAGVRVRVEKADHTAVEGTLAVPTLPIDTAHGRLDLAMARVRSLDLAAEGGTPTVVVELEDKSRLRGTPAFDALPVTTAGGTVERVPVSDAREVKVLREVDLSVWAIVLGLVTLSAMEIVLGVDNVIVLAILVGRLPKDRQPQARRIGLGAALGTRILLLFTLTWLLGLTKPLFRIPVSGVEPDVRDVSGRDLILFVGGAFLIYKSVKEMHAKLEEARGKRAAGGAGTPVRPAAGFAGVILQIAIVDIVFSLDSVITAVGMVETLWVMVVAMVIAMIVMLAFAGPIAEFVDRHPTVKMLALSFLILIGVLLVAEAMGQHISKGYIYFAMAFAVAMELINMRLRPKAETVAEGAAAVVADRTGAVGGAEASSGPERPPDLARGGSSG